MFMIKSKVTELWIWGQFKRRSGKKLFVMVAAWAEKEGSWSMLYLHARVMDAIFLSDTRDRTGN